MVLPLGLHELNRFRLLHPSRFYFYQLYYSPLLRKKIYCRIDLRDALLVQLGGNLCPAVDLNRSKLIDFSTADGIESDTLVLGKVWLHQKVSVIHATVAADLWTMSDT